jgi:hypothetical protein
MERENPPPACRCMTLWEWGEGGRGGTGEWCGILYGWCALPVLLFLFLFLLCLPSSFFCAVPPRGLVVLDVASPQLHAWGPVGVWGHICRSMRRIYRSMTTLMYEYQDTYVGVWGHIHMYIWGHICRSMRRIYRSMRTNMWEHEDTYVGVWGHIEAWGHIYRSMRTWK